MGEERCAHGIAWLNKRAHFCIELLMPETCKNTIQIVYMYVYKYVYNDM
jgi:hypothetical protein